MEKRGLLIHLMRLLLILKIFHFRSTNQENGQSRYVAVHWWLVDIIYRSIYFDAAVKRIIYIQITNVSTRRDIGGELFETAKA